MENKYLVSLFTLSFIHFSAEISPYHFFLLTYYDVNQPVLQDTSWASLHPIAFPEVYHSPSLLCILQKLVSITSMLISDMAFLFLPQWTMEFPKTQPTSCSTVSGSLANIY
jgi:hypothetical protein